MKNTIFVLLACALLVHQSYAVACTKSLTANANSGGGCSDQTGTLYCTGSAQGSAGTCTASCSNTASATQCVGTDSTYCNANSQCIAAPSCTASNAATTCTDANNNFCVGASTTTATCGQTCTNSAATSQCVDNTRPYCALKSGSTTVYTCQAAPSCTASSGCSDTNNAQCINSKCAAACNHASGAYCTDSATTSAKVYCSSATSTGTCQAAAANSGLTDTTKIPSNCLVGTSTTVCTACKPGYGLSTNSSATTCVACSAACNECYKGNDNTSCVAYKYPLDGVYRTDTTQSLANCSSGYVPGAITSGVYTCYNCSTNCTNCLSPNTANLPTANSPAICQACAAGSYLNGSVTVLNSSSAANVTVGYNCIGCPANCTSCTNSTYCIKCNGSLVWNNSTKKCFGAKIGAGVFTVAALAVAVFAL